VLVIRTSAFDDKERLRRIQGLKYVRRSARGLSKGVFDMLHVFSRTEESDKFMITLELFHFLMRMALFPQTIPERESQSDSYTSKTCNLNGETYPHSMFDAHYVVGTGLKGPDHLPRTVYLPYPR